MRIDPSRQVGIEEPILTPYASPDHVMYAIPYVGTVPDMPNIPNILTNVGHRFGHQSSLGRVQEEAGPLCLYGVAFRVYLVFPNIAKTSNINTQIKFVMHSGDFSMDGGMPPRLEPCKIHFCIDN